MIEEYRRALETLFALVAEAAMDGVLLEVPQDAALAELERIYMLASPEDSRFSGG